MKELQNLKLQLKTLYKNSPVEVKKEAWKIFGHTDEYFRALMAGKKDHAIDSILSAIQALKQAYINKEVDYIEDFQDKKEELIVIEDKFTTLKAKDIKVNL